MNGTWSYLLASEHHPQYVSLAPLHSSHVVYWLQFWTTIFTNCEIKIRNFEWHLEMTKVNVTHIIGPPPPKKNHHRLFYNFINICVWIEKVLCGLRENFILFVLGVGGGGRFGVGGLGFYDLFLDSPSRTTSPLNRLMTNQCIIWLVTYKHTIF